MRAQPSRLSTGKELHLLCAGGVDAFEALPIAIRNLGPWTGSKEGEVDRLRLPYRAMLTEQGFTIVYANIGKLCLEAPTGPPVLRGQAECPDCKGSGEVDQQGDVAEQADPQGGWRSGNTCHSWLATHPSSPRVSSGAQRHRWSCSGTPARRAHTQSGTAAWRWAVRSRLLI